MSSQIRRFALLPAACAALLVLASCGDHGHDHSGDGAHNQTPAKPAAAAEAGWMSMLGASAALVERFNN